MTKKILLGILLSLGAFAGRAYAGVPDPDFIRSTATVHAPISVSSSTATQIDAGSTLLIGRFVAVVDNEGADNIRCAFSSAVTQTANGFLIRSGTPYVIKLSSNIPLFCIATGATSINVSLLQGKSQ